MDTLTFRWRGRYGHFLRAEANRNALTYLLPPRTTLLGVVAAVLGLPKDALATELADARVAVAGGARGRFWHTGKLRKDPPAPLPCRISRGSKTERRTQEEKATLISQEWLLEPDYRVHLALPGQPERFAELQERLRERRWHFSPCLGLSELLADLEFVDSGAAQPLPPGRYPVRGACRVEEVRLCAGEGIGVHLLRMPRAVSPERVFSHASYYVEHRGGAFPVETACAWQVAGTPVLFL